ncbi:MAG: hypothetical protein ABIN05_00290 [candidate division WOR-3 bacterium]
MKKILFFKVFILFSFIFVYSSQRYNQLFIEKALEKRNFIEFDDETYCKIARNYFIEGNFENFLGTLRNIENEEIKIFTVERSFNDAIEKKNYDFAIKLIENLNYSFKTRFYLKIAYEYIKDQNLSKAKKYFELSESFLSYIKNDFEKTQSKILLGKGFGLVKEMSKSLSLLSSAFWETNRVKNKTEKAILLVELFDAYRKLNLSVNSKLVEIQLGFENDPEILLTVSEKFFEKGDSTSSRKYLDLAYKNRNRIKNNIKKTLLLSQITNDYHLLNDKAKLANPFKETIREAKSITKRVERVKMILSVLRFNNDENLEKLLIEDISMVKDDRLKNEMLLKLIETYLIKGEEEKGFLLLKMFINELKTNNNDNVLFYLHLISEMYANYGSVPSCLDFIKILKRDFKKYPSVISKMYIYKNDFTSGFEYIKLVKENQEKIPLLYLFLEETFKKEDNSLNNRNLQEVFQLISKIDDKKFKSMLLLDISYLILKYNVNIDNKTLYYLETI